MDTPTLVHNDDSYSCLGHMRLGHARADLEQWVDLICDTPMQAFVACAAQPDHCYYETKCGEQIGCRAGIRIDSALLWHVQKVYAELRSEGTDQLRVWAQRTHARGRQFLAGIRMSDAHHRWTHNIPAEEYFLYPKYTFDHPELRIRKADGSLDVTLDYANETVREYRFAIIEEIVRNYPIDGLELDFMRWCSHFPFPATPEHIGIMTDYLRRIRRLLDDEAARRNDGRRLIIGVRVPRTIAECAPNGLDPATWMREGLADFLSPCAFLFTDMNVALDEWVAMAKGTGCRVLHSIQPWWAGSWSDNGKYNAAFSIEDAEYRAYAANGWVSGAHGMHSFNMCCELPGRTTEMQQALRMISDPAAAWAGPRHYQYFPTGEDNGITGTEHTQRLHFKETGVPQTYRFIMGDGTRAGRITGRIGWRIQDAVCTDTWRVRLNGHEIPAEKIQALSCCHGCNLRPGGSLPAHFAYTVDMADIPAMALHNELEITPLHLEPTWNGERRMNVVEAWCADR